MSIWLIGQIVFNVITTLIIFILWAKLKRPPQEDPRMSRGLQLLQSKIAIMENLSDRTEEQFKNINQLIEKKSEKLQKFIIKSEEQVIRLESSMNKSNEIANIFQDKIPHNEVIERKQRMQMITAARMAHQGASVDEIIDRVKLPKSQVELITKVNKDKLVFDDKSLPSWVKKLEETSVEFVEDEVESEDVYELSNSIEQTGAQSNEAWVEGRAAEVFTGDKLIDTDQMDRIKKMGDDFKTLCTNYQDRQRELDYEIENNLTRRMFNGAEVAGQAVAKNFSDVSQVLTSNIGEVSQTVAKNVGNNINSVSHQVIDKASSLGHNVLSQVGGVSKKVVENAGAVSQKIVEKTGSVLESKSKTKIKKVKFHKIDSDKEIY